MAVLTFYTNEQARSWYDPSDRELSNTLKEVRKFDSSVFVKENQYTFRKFPFFRKQVKSRFHLLIRTRSGEYQWILEAGSTADSVRKYLVAYLTGWENCISQQEQQHKASIH